jgi:hypothetical protein
MTTMTTGAAMVWHLAMVRHLMAGMLVVTADLGRRRVTVMRVPHRLVGVRHGGVVRACVVMCVVISHVIASWP